MSRLPAVTASEMVRVLKRAGFVEHHQKGSHLYDTGQNTLRSLTQG